MGRESLSKEVTFETRSEYPLRTGYVKTGKKYSEQREQEGNMMVEGKCYGTNGGGKTKGGGRNFTFCSV